MKIVLWPDPVLKTPSDPLTYAPDPGLIKDMLAMMRNSNGVGLSAIQVGIPQQLFVSSAGGVDRVFVNPSWYTPPSLYSTGGPSLKVEVEEGCLSTPGQYAKVKRFPAVVVTYRDEKFDLQPMLMATGLLAQVVQHECEHLRGEMFLDHLKSAERSRIMGTMMKLKRSGGRK